MTMADIEPCPNSIELEQVDWNGLKKDWAKDSRCLVYAERVSFTLSLSLAF